MSNKLQIIVDKNSKFMEEIEHDFYLKYLGKKMDLADQMAAYYKEKTIKVKMDNQLIKEAREIQKDLALAQDFISANPFVQPEKRRKTEKIFNLVEDDL